MSWQEISISLTPGAEDEAAEIFYLIGARGVVIEDPRVAAGYIERKEWDYYELSPGFLESNKVTVKGYIPLDADWPRKWEKFGRLIQALPPGTVHSTSVIEVMEEKWAHAWKAYFKPLKVGNRLVVCPSWESYLPQPGELVIRLDPGMAFGTGTHPTTSLCIQELEALLPGKRRVADVGTGSGILAIAAALLGAEKVTAIDSDSSALKAAKENVDNNGVSDRVTVAEGDLLFGVTEKQDLIVANIVADAVKRLAGQAALLLETDGVFLASGIITDRLDDVCEHFRKSGLAIKETKREGYWCLVAACLGEVKDASI